ncbi:MAG: hypothetical protein ACXACX_19470 [Candidatus Hodarchaeales archaeon]|jgi:hypothetical protein
MPTIDIDEKIKSQLKGLKSIEGAKTYSEVVNLLIKRYDTESYYDPLLTLVLDRLDTLELKINDLAYEVLKKQIGIKTNDTEIDKLSNL